MIKKILFLGLIFLASFSFLLPSPLSFHYASGDRSLGVQDNGFRVHNADTGLGYSTIQEAINAPETKDRHTITVGSGIYYEHVVLDKELSLLGETKDETIIDGNGKGVILHVKAENVVIKNLTIQNGDYGIRLEDARNSTLVRNNVYNTRWFGVELDRSGSSALRDNRFVGNRYNFGVDGTSLFDFINDIDVSNTVNGKPVYYLMNQRDFTINSSTFEKIGYLALINSTDIKVENLRLTDNKEGLLFAYVTNATITKLVATGNWNGIYVKYSSNVSVFGNEANDNFDYGIKFFVSNSSMVYDNNANDNVWSGIGLFKSNNLTITGNNASNSIYCLHLVYSNGSRIIGNNAIAREDGYSIALYYSNDNLIYHNNFVNAILYTPVKSRNMLDDGYDGNHWRSYDGIDSDQDGIGDTAHVLGEGNQDNRPLMGPVTNFAATWQGQIYDVTAISNSTISQFQFSPADGIISFKGTSEAQTVGFCRITIPDAIIQGLQNNNLTVLANGRPPITQKNWTDGARTHLYLTYIHVASSTQAIPVLLAALTLILVLTLAFVIIIKRQSSSQQTEHTAEKHVSSVNTCNVKTCWRKIVDFCVSTMRTIARPRSVINVAPR